LTVGLLVSELGACGLTVYVLVVVDTAQHRRMLEVRVLMVRGRLWRLMRSFTATTNAC